ncbi:lysosome-associated membrane glycoprotein 3 [Eublepharis macularius]|uniref:Lysosome-associated membrane glycoprotein 3 n=1 Tax=Eublepharis macularius TaxID=481883 RepID=A0AA97JGT5_EUBMA|nr:lysosome-associated membrane glycoprotein 3 [Eublepharis macularius]
MSCLKLLVVGSLLVLGSAILPCSALAPDDGRQAHAAWQSNSFPPRSRFPPQPVSSPLNVTFLADESEASATQASPGIPPVADQTPRSRLSAGQTTGHILAKGAGFAPGVTPANPTQTTSHALTPTLLKAAGGTAVQSEPLTDQTRVYTVLKPTAASQKIASDTRPSHSRERTAHPRLSTTGNAKDTGETTHNHVTVHLTNLTTSPHTAHTGAWRNGTSARAGNKTTTPLPTAPPQPTLSPKPAPAATGNYSVQNGTADCIKASLGLTIIVRNGDTKKTEYLNIDPNATQTSGSCGNQLSTLNITFRDGFIRFTFKKTAAVYYLYAIEASLRVPSDGLLYYGIVLQLFSAPMGSSFKCLSKQTINMDTNFQLLAVNTQLQAFDIVGNQFGKEEECAVDRNKKIIPLTIGLSVAGLLVIAITTCVLYSKKPNRGYDRI